jgi:hypothetical protein
MRAGFANVMILEVYYIMLFSKCTFIKELLIKLYVFSLVKFNHGC